MKPFLCNGECNTPKYTQVVFDMFRVFCKHNLRFRELNAKHGNERPGNLQDLMINCNFAKKGNRSHKMKRLWVKIVCLS